jgi:hypothetical protein
VHLDLFSISSSDHTKHREFQPWKPGELQLAKRQQIFMASRIMRQSSLLESLRLQDIFAIERSMTHISYSETQNIISQSSKLIPVHDVDIVFSPTTGAIISPINLLSQCMVDGTLETDQLLYTVIRTRFSPEQFPRAPILQLCALLLNLSTRYTKIILFFSSGDLISDPLTKSIGRGYNKLQLLVDKISELCDLEIHLSLLSSIQELSFYIALETTRSKAIFDFYEQESLVGNIK